MKKTGLKMISVLLSLVIVFSGLNMLPFVEIGAVIARAVDSTPIPGDINGDGTPNNKDLTRLMKYLAGDSVSVTDILLDTNGDGNINNKDLTRLMRYIAGDDVEIHPIGCTHNKQAVAAVAPTCTTGGNIAYWRCDECDKYFTDKNGMNECVYIDVLLDAKGHTPVEDAAMAPTYESTGLTAGSHCSVCNEVLQAQEVVPMLQKTEYAITYDLYNGDTYLQTVGVENSNPSLYAKEDGLTLKNLKATGYKFLGWYDLPAGSNAEIVKSIPAGTTGEIELYAHWEKEVYPVEFEFPTQFNADLITLGEVTYTVDKGVVLPAPQLEGYIFAGWSDDDGTIIKKVPVGSTGAKQYTANWLSKRNQAWTKQHLDDPIIIEDTDSNVILFTYEIGEIRNVPVYEIENFGYVNANGISKTITKTFSTTVSESLMQEYTNTVSSSTVNSYGWTLSNSWSDGTTIDEEWCNEKGISQEEAESYCKSDTDGWYVSSGKSGSKTKEVLSSVDSYNLTTNTSNAQYDIGGTNSSTHAGSVSNALTVEAGLEIEAKQSANAGIYSAELGVKGNVGASDTFSTSSSDSHSNSTNRNYSFSGGSSKQGGTISHTGTNTTTNSSWNSESGYNGSSTVTNNSSVSKAISESISNKYGYGKTYIENGGEESTQGLSSTESSSDSYSSSVTYSTETSEEQTLSYTTSGTISGYHRWVMADTAHVFAIVGYDIATASYFVNTYTVMEDNLKPYEDYSCSSANYDDCQNSFIAFEVPYDTITEYVGNRVAESKGLEVNSAGIITAYTGTDEYVVIPEYKVIHNQDGTNTVIKVTGISENAFKGNTKITGVLLSSLIDEIPDNAFKGCTALTEVQSCVSKIGSNAFSGCTSMKAVALGYGITSIGDKAFDSVEDISIYAINKSVVSAVVNSGAKNITIYVTDACESMDNTTLEIPATTEVFTFNGLGKTYNNLRIVSDAAMTAINRATFVSTGKTPLQLSSVDVQLQEVTVNASGIGLICSAATTNLSLYGESYINSDSTNAILTKNIVLGKIKDDFFSQLHAKGNVLVCGQVTNESFLDVTNGEVIYIDLTEYDKYKQGTIVVTFDPNGGSVSPTTKTVYFGQSYGDLPTPTRTGWTFKGWYTAKSGGNQVTSTTNVTSVSNQTLYAIWQPNSYKVSWSTGTGYSITVKRTSSPNAGAATGNLSSGATVYYGDVLSVTYTSSTGYTISGKGSTSITVTGNVTSSNIYATASVNSYTASWSTGTGYSITVNRTSSPKAGAATGNLSSGAKVYYGDVLSVTYTASTGYTINSKGSTSITVTGNVTSSNIYATATVNSYTASWSTGTGYSITVNRTSSPKAGASTGKLSSGAKVYYGDVLSVTYTASTGYSISSKGSTSITVTGNVTSSNIYASASANSYTYTIKYVSTNGTDLGSSSATYKFGTTNTISAPAKSGYATPSSQSVKWDATSKTITFRYSPTSQPTTQTIDSGTWWKSSSGNSKITYKVEAQWRNRTATSIEIRVCWTNTITNPYNNGYYGYKQEFEWWGWNTIAEASAFSSAGGTRSSSSYSDWHTYTISPTDTTRSIGSEWKDNNGKSGEWGGTVSIPAY